MAYQLKIMQKGLDARGNVVALCSGAGFSFGEDMSLYSVWYRKGSYCSSAPNQIAYRWVYIQRSMSLEAAQSLFNRRVK